MTIKLLLMLFVGVLGFSETALAEYMWAPMGGATRVGRTLATNSFIFGPRTSNKFGPMDSYEHETHLARNYATSNCLFRSRWYSTMPYSYCDTEFPYITQDVDDFTIGSYQADALLIRTIYRTRIRMTPTSPVGTKTRSQIKGQKGHRSAGFCDRYPALVTWCIWSDETTIPALSDLTAPHPVNIWGITRF